MMFVIEDFRSFKYFYDRLSLRDSDLIFKSGFEEEEDHIDALCHFADNNKSSNIFVKIDNPDILDFYLKSISIRGFSCPGPNVFFGLDLTKDVISVIPRFRKFLEIDCQKVLFSDESIKFTIVYSRVKDYFVREGKKVIKAVIYSDEYIVWN